MEWDDDGEFDNWLSEENARLVVSVTHSIDIEATLARIRCQQLLALGVQAGEVQVAGGPGGVELTESGPEPAQVAAAWGQARARPGSSGNVSRCGAAAVGYHGEVYPVSMTYTPPWANPYIAQEDIRRDMSALLEKRRNEGKPCLMYVHGLEGLGVSCLVSQFSLDNRRMIGRPPIWLAGRQPDGTAVPLGELLRQALRGFDVPESEQGATDADRVAVYQRASRGQVFMLVVDDVVTAAQVLSFVPLDAPNAVIVATGQFDNRALRREGFTPFAPELLPDDAARELFKYALGDTAGELDESVRNELADQCGGFPLLLKVLGAQIEGRPRVVRRLLTSLRSSKLELLALDSEQRMTQFLDVTYSTLTALQQRTYRRSALLPGTVFHVDAVAAALGEHPDQTAAALDELVDFNLLTFVGEDRYRCHEVIRAHARKHAETDEGADACAEIVALALTWYLKQALPRDAALSGRWWVDSTTELMTQWYGNTPPTFTRDEVRDWFSAEIPGLVAGIRLAHKRALHDVAWQLCVAVYKFLHQHGYHAYWLATHQDGLASAEAAGATDGVMHLNLQLGAAHLAIGEYAQARDRFEKAQEVAHTIPVPLGEQSALEWRGKTYAAEGAHDRALDFYQQSWDVTEAAGDRISSAQRARVLALLRLQQARSWIANGQWRRARQAATEARDYFDRHTDETDNQAKTRLALGRALLGDGQASEATIALREAVELFTMDGSSRSLAEAQYRLGEALILTSQPGQAAEVLRAALAYYVETGSDRVDVVGALLDTLS